MTKEQFEHINKLYWNIYELEHGITTFKKILKDCHYKSPKLTVEYNFSIPREIETIEVRLTEEILTVLVKDMSEKLLKLKEEFNNL